MTPKWEKNIETRFELFHITTTNYAHVMDQHKDKGEKILGFSNFLGIKIQNFAMHVYSVQFTMTTLNKIQSNHLLLDVA